MKNNKILVQIDMHDKASLTMQGDAPSRNFLLSRQINALISLDGSIDILQNYPHLSIPDSHQSENRLQPITIVGK